jgi:monothiol glutaredoxin
MRPELKAHIESLIKNNPVILFMKGTKDRPQCGFSKQVVSVLNQLVSDFVTVDVLADPEIREGIKIYSNWPTIPQLYIDNEFIGGCDIVLDLANKEELHKLLKLEKAQKAPQLNLSQKAHQAFSDALAEQGEDEAIRITIGADFNHELAFDKAQPHDFHVKVDSLRFIFDAYSARRADNLTIDFIEDQLESGFAFNNPNEGRMHELSVTELNNWHKENKDFILLDVRTKEEWQQAHISFAKRLEDISPSDIATWNKDRAIIFHCHHGSRSKRAAKSFLAKNFRRVYNLTGGIDAWARFVDPEVPLY